jgi:hypothetical protein
MRLQMSYLVIFMKKWSVLIEKWVFWLQSDHPNYVIFAPKVFSQELVPGWETPILCWARSWLMREKNKVIFLGYFAHKIMIWSHYLPKIGSYFSWYSQIKITYIFDIIMWLLIFLLIFYEWHFFTWLMTDDWWFMAGWFMADWLVTGDWLLVDWQQIY